MQPLIVNVKIVIMKMVHKYVLNVLINVLNVVMEMNVHYVEVELEDQHLLPVVHVILDIMKPGPII